MKKIISILLVCLAMTTSCVDTVILPDNKTVDEDYWQKKSEVDAVVAAAYSQLRDATLMRNLVVWGDFRSDELVLTSTLPASAAYKVALSQIYAMQVETNNPFTTWFPFYSCINYCNLVLEKAESVIAIDPDYSRGDYQSNCAQVKALRALCYFHLVRVFHDVPVTPGAYMDSSADLAAPQMAPATVLQMCIDDLLEAEKYAVASNTFGNWRDRGLMNKDAIWALLADIYLWRASINRDVADYNLCVEYCDKVIASKHDKHELTRFETESDYYLAPYNKFYSDIWGAEGQNAEESIFELQNRSSRSNNTGLMQVYFNYNAKRNDGFGYFKAATKYGVVDPTGNGVWVNANDYRLKEFLYDATNSSTEQFGVRKFCATGSSGGNTDSKRDGRGESFIQNWIFYRLTDVMLMKAEALVQLYTIDNQGEEDLRNEEAFNICQAVNDRALTDAEKSTSSSSSSALKYSVYKDKMEQLVLAERARELCFEGKRWYDLLRYNYRHTATKADLTKKLSESYVGISDEFYELALRKYAVPSTMKAKMRDERYLYMPINQDEMDLNPNLKQNPVYKSAVSY